MDIRPGLVYGRFPIHTSAQYTIFVLFCSVNYESKYSQALHVTTGPMKVFGVADRRRRVRECARMGVLSHVTGM